MNPEEKECLESLRNSAMPENDLYGWIDCAGTLLLVEAVPELIALLINERYSFATREQAARTIDLLGSGYASSKIVKLRKGATRELNALLDIVEGINPSEN